MAHVIYRDNIVNRRSFIYCSLAGIWSDLLGQAYSCTLDWHGLKPLLSQTGRHFTSSKDATVASMPPARECQNFRVDVYSFFA